MGFYIRKSFRAGPVRLNLSKSGLGLSAGVKGFRVGSGPRGNYVHAGRGGLYYRKNLGSNTKYRSTSQNSAGSIGIVGVIIALVLIIFVGQWFVENPAVFIFIVAIAALIAGTMFYKKTSRDKAIAEYKKILDEIFVLETLEFNEEKLKGIKNKLVHDCKAESEEIEQNIYNAVLDKIIDDDEITPKERETIKKLESIISISDSNKTETKLEIFKSYYLNAIEDRLITNSEIDTLNNIVEGLGINDSDIKEEMQTVKEIIKIQTLKHPLSPLETVPITIQKSEKAFYSSMGKVLSRKKAPKNSSSEYEYSIRKEGNLIV
ncbi:MAG: DUF4236 domain-containing protein, partial [Proteobacteria bacterium]|nr:DUF4236 domain-containing protein [Pseudomonadota bacterium]